MSQLTTPATEGMEMDLEMSASNLKSFNTLRLRENGHHFPDNIFTYIFLNENVWISINISLNFVPKCPVAC